MPMFAKRRGAGRVAAKESVIERLRAYCERFADIVPPDYVKQDFKRDGIYEPRVIGL